MLAPDFGDRVRLEELTVNYRSPARITRWAAQVARAAGLEISSPEAVREGEHAPELTVVPGASVTELAVAAVEAERARVPEGLLAVIVPVDDVAAHLDAQRARWGERADRTPVPGVEVVVVTARETKGLEFDSVVLVSPERIVADAEGVVGDLYVSMTRCTQSVRVVSTAVEADLPAGLVPLPA